LGAIKPEGLVEDRMFPIPGAEMPPTSLEIYVVSDIFKMGRSMAYPRPYSSPCFLKLSASTFCMPNTLWDFACLGAAMLAARSFKYFSFWFS